MKTHLPLSVILLVSLLGLTTACPGAQNKPDAVPGPTTADATAKKEAATAWVLARPKPDWITARVSRATGRLEKSEPGKLILAAIKAHGGLDTWYAAGPLSFRFAYKPVNQKRIRDTFQTIDTWSSRGVHMYAEDKTKTFGFDGKQAWYTGEKGTINPRFWTLTPFYFVAVPFVFADEGIKLTKEPQPFVFEERTYDQVRVTYDAGTGDAPDDFYVVLIDQKTKRIGGVRYIVSYKGFFPNGGHSPEKVMIYDGAQTISGITFPKTFRTFTLKKDKTPDTLVTNSSMTDVSFKPDLPATFFNTPKDASVFKGWMNK